MKPNLVETAVHITVHEANHFQPARARVAYYGADGRIQRTDHPVSQVDALIADIEAAGVDVTQRPMWKRLEVTINRPKPQRPALVMTDADREWLAAQQRMASYAPSGRGTRASFNNRLAIARGRGNR
ncbi:MAG: hypothetical protein KDK05_06630 [Candidatus Competibacteraceae bacterium]|nr:hypothetical protein [Candidatus Competibacteraceae bacterium]